MSGVSSCGKSTSKIFNRKTSLDISEATLKESEFRVFYLWSQKDKHENPKPLACEICKIWHTRLGTHVKNIQHFSNDEITRRKNETRSKYWNSAEIKINIGITESDTPLASREKMTRNDIDAHLLNRDGEPVEYLQWNAIALIKFQRE